MIFLIALTVGAGVSALGMWATTWESPYMWAFKDYERKSYKRNIANIQSLMEKLRK